MKIETPFQLKSKLISVSAIVAGPIAKSPWRLVLDTAAVYTTLARHVAEAVGLSIDHALRSTVIRSAVGDERGYLVNLDQLTTLGLVFRNVEANIADLGYGIDGLIGMNVLGQLNFEVRPVERRILVEKIAS
jgi:clan AA aspartic protease (TIGR02281 family)